MGYTAKAAGKGRGKAAKPAPAVADDTHRRDLMVRLRRVEGQIRGVVAMIEQGQGCDDVAQQLAAARKALDRAFFEMLACSLESEAGDADPELSARLAARTRLIAKYA